MVVPALGSAGSPSSLMGVACFFWWAWSHVQRSGPTGQPFQLMRVAVLAWLVVMVIVYAHAMSGPIPRDEISVADNGMLRLLGLAGVLLLAHDGITSPARLHLLLRRLAMAAGAVAILGLLQYLTHRLLVDQLSIPGLTRASLGDELGSRSGFARPSGTSTSPIEYGVVLALALPIMIALAGSQQRHRFLFRLLLVPAVASIYFSVSRSAYLCTLVGLLVMAIAWNNRQRLQALALLMVASTAVYVSVPGLLGAIRGLFSNAGKDPSVASRTGSYDVAGRFIADSPLLGRGFGTFLPKYWILDNGYLGLLIEGGILGLAGLLVVTATGVLAARRAKARASHQDDRQLAHAVLASIIAAAAGTAFFDIFAFPQSAGGLFLMLGLAGAMRRLSEPAVAT
ncbi:O-antigen ligase family protein [Nocardioides exalbidus]|nr:O-antigen ligase family protein [Nocardioides exalbidus]